MNPRNVITPGMMPASPKPENAVNAPVCDAGVFSLSLPGPDRNELVWKVEVSSKKLLKNARVNQTIDK